MFFITGGAALLLAIHRLAPCGFTDALAAQLVHTEWDGFTWYDMIFPLFLYIAGVSFPFSFAKSRSLGLGRGAILRKAGIRVLALIALGFVFNGIFKLDFANFRWYSVLGRIGLAWGLAALVYCFCGFRGRLGVIAGILVTYALLTALLLAPDAPPGATPLSKEGNIVGYIDRMIFGTAHLYRGEVFDPQGLLSALPAVATALLGMAAGDWLSRSCRLGATPDIRYRHARGPLKKLRQEFSDAATHGPARETSSGVLCLAIAGGLLIGAGLLLDLVIPINKPLWSSSYVLFAGGISTLLLALFHWIIDVKGWKAWSLYFRVIGMNSITIYMLQKIVDLKKATRFFFGGLSDLLPEHWGGLVMAIGYLMVCYLILWFLWKRKIFLKV